MRDTKNTARHAPCIIFSSAAPAAEYIGRDFVCRRLFPTRNKCGIGNGLEFALLMLCAQCKLDASTKWKHPFAQIYAL